MISYASGARFINLLGGEMLSFYDWYADLPPASPQIWGEQTNVPESSDWYNAAYIIMWGSNVPLTRTPDAHFMTEVRYKGTKVISVAPDYAENVKFADNWLAPHPGTDAAVAQAMTHVILQEFYENEPNDMFINYAKQYTDMPFVIMLDQDENGYKAGRFLRASDLGIDSENSEWKPVIFDCESQQLVVPNGTMGQRWEEGKKWNLKLENEDGTKLIRLYLWLKKIMNYKLSSSHTLIVRVTACLRDLFHLARLDCLMIKKYIYQLFMTLWRVNMVFNVLTMNLKLNPMTTLNPNIHQHGKNLLLVSIED